MCPLFSILKNKYTTFVCGVYSDVLSLLIKQQHELFLFIATKNFFFANGLHGIETKKYKIMYYPSYEENTSIHVKIAIESTQEVFYE